MKFNPDDSPATGRVGCPHPFKIAFGSRSAARKARQHFSRGKGDRLSAYLCVCENWHLGKLPSTVKHGKLTRDEI